MGGFTHLNSDSIESCNTHTHTHAHVARQVWGLELIDCPPSMEILSVSLLIGGLEACNQLLTDSFKRQGSCGQTNAIALYLSKFKHVRTGQEDWSECYCRSRFRQQGLDSLISTKRLMLLTLLHRGAPSTASCLFPEP